MDVVNRLLKGICATAILIVSGTSQAALLGLQLAFPQLSYTTTGGALGADYDSGTNDLTIISTPYNLTNTDGSSVFIGAGSMSLTVNVDESGAVTTAGSFELKDGSTVLLTGSVDDFGSQPGINNTTVVDFALTVTSGTLSTDFFAANSTGAASAAMSLLGSTFTDFDSDWTAGDAKGAIGPIPSIPELPAHTIGYWKNHPDDWTYVVLNICGTNMNQEDLIGVLSTPVRGDKTISMAHQLIASTLNSLSGSSCAEVDQAIVDGEAWLCSHGGIGGSRKQWDGGEVFKNALDDFNNDGCI